MNTFRTYIQSHKLLTITALVVCITIVLLALGTLRSSATVDRTYVLHYPEARIVSCYAITVYDGYATCTWANNDSTFVQAQVPVECGDSSCQSGDCGSSWRWNGSDWVKVCRCDGSTSGCHNE